MRSVRPLGGGVSKRSYDVRLAGSPGRAVLALYVRDGERRDVDLAVHERVAAVVPVPETLWAGEVAGRPATLSRWVAGSRLDEVRTSGSDDDVAGVARAVGAALAAIGTMTFSECGFFTGPDLAVQPWPVSAAGVLDWAGRQLGGAAARATLGTEVCRRWLALIESAAPVLDDLPPAWTLVHSDFNGKNLLVTRGSRWEVAAVLDWEFAFAGPPLADIGNLLRFADRRTPVFDAAFVDGFLAGGGVLPPDWREAARVLDVYAQVEMLSRTPVRHHPIRAAVIALVREVVRRGSI